MLLTFVLFFEKKTYQFIYVFCSSIYYFTKIKKKEKSRVYTHICKRTSFYTFLYSMEVTIETFLFYSIYYQNEVSN